MAVGGAVIVRVLDPAMKDIPTSRWSMLNACVDEPSRTRTTWEMLAASGVETVNCSPHVTVLGLGALVMVGRVAGITLLFESRVNR